MSRQALAEHMERPLGRGHIPADASTGAAGGGACGDLIRISLSLDGGPAGRIADAGFDARGCGAVIAAGSAVVGLLAGATLLQAALIGAEEIANELGGLSPAKRHAAELASDALHRALGACASHVQLTPTSTRTLVAMSGGVDSAVAALLAKRSAQQTVAVTLELWSDPQNDGERSCCSAEAVRAARALAHSMGIPHFSVDLRAQFRAGVVDPWLSQYARGLTANPCLRCNGSVRLDAMLALAQRLGAPTLTTGHYARVYDADAREGPLLRVAAEQRKDQSYALAALPPSSLKRLRFPLGELTKANVRELARDAGLAVAGKPDSQDLCFLAGTSVSSFLQRHGGLQRRPGVIVDRHGNAIGRHEGHFAFTVGQRRGLGIAADKPLYVLCTDAASNTVTVGEREDLLTRTIVLVEAVLHRGGACVDAVKIRSRGQRIPARLPGASKPGSHERLTVELLAPLERTAPGQVACLFCGELLVGYGTIGKH